ncbi:MAG: citrate synthase [Acidobacteria bacterium]|nr:citrate synthase [Acidobacteriota bacterium]
MPADTLTLTDNRTGKTYEIPIADGTIRAIDLRQIKTSADDFGMMTYDPGFLNTASCKSRITFIDGDKGILEYRGYPIAQLAEQSNFLEVCYLTLRGELPNPAQLAEWTAGIRKETSVDESSKNVLAGFQRDAHPMGMFISSLAALGTLYPESKRVSDPAVRLASIYRLMAKAPILAACGYRHSKGLPYVAPNPDLSYAGNFLTMMFASADGKYDLNPALERAMDILFILHADHEQNCSTSTMRVVGSAQTDPYTSAAAAASALYGPLHGGANEAVLSMLRVIGSKDRIPEYVQKVKAGEVKLMGFGHRVYKNYDPRARIIKRAADEVFAVTGKNPLLEMAIELERIALEDEYFVKRKLYPNVDFYSGIIYEAMGFPTPMFTVLFALGRMIGWLAQWDELVQDSDQKISRPRQVFLGPARRDFAPMDQR